LLKRNLIVDLDVLRVRAQLVGDLVHLGEQIRRRRGREMQNRVSEVPVMVSHRR